MKRLCITNALFLLQKLVKKFRPDAEEPAGPATALKPAAPQMQLTESQEKLQQELSREQAAAAKGPRHLVWVSSREM